MPRFISFISCVIDPTLDIMRYLRRRINFYAPIRERSHSILSQTVTVRVRDTTSKRGSRRIRDVLTSSEALLDLRSYMTSMCERALASNIAVCPRPSAWFTSALPLRGIEKRLLHYPWQTFALPMTAKLKDSQGQFQYEYVCIKNKKDTFGAHLMDPLDGEDGLLQGRSCQGPQEL